MNITQEDADLIFAEDEQLDKFYSVHKFICNKISEAVKHCNIYNIDYDDIITWYKENVC